MTNEELLEWLDRIDLLIRRSGEGLFSDDDALAQLRALLQEPTDEERKELLIWLDGKELTARFIFENNTSQDARYHAQRDLYFFGLIRALIEKRTEK